MMSNDRDLRDRFAALRRQEEAQAPKFTAPRKPVRPRSLSALLAAAACLLAIATAGLWMRATRRHPQPEPGKPVASLMAWKPPTDFLLETPGREMLRSVPAIGAFDDSLIASTHPRRNPPPRKPVLP
jgi:hypothetical protein